MTIPGNNKSNLIQEWDIAKEIYSERERIHLLKFSWDNFKKLIEKWVTYFFQKQEVFENIDEFQIHLETVTEEYVGYFISGSSNILSQDTRKRMNDIVLLYHEMFYDWEHDPVQASLNNNPEVAKQVAQKSLLFSYRIRQLCDCIISGLKKRV